MNEIWTDIKEYEGYYQVSNLGRVKSLARLVIRGGRTGNINTKDRILKQALNTDKYRHVSLKKDGVGKTFRVHRLVALHHIPNPENKREVNHLFGKEFNTTNDLEWATPVENVTHAFKVGFKTGNVGKINGKSKVVIDLDTGIFYDCAREAAYAKNIKNTTLISRLNGTNPNKTQLRYI